MASHIFNCRMFTTIVKYDVRLILACKKDLEEVLDIVLLLVVSMKSPLSLSLSLWFSKENSSTYRIVTQYSHQYSRNNTYCLQKIIEQCLLLIYYLQKIIEQCLLLIYCLQKMIEHCLLLIYCLQKIIERCLL